MSKRSREEEDDGKYGDRDGDYDRGEDREARRRKRKSRFDQGPPATPSKWDVAPTAAGDAAAAAALAAAGVIPTGGHSNPVVPQVTVKQISVSMGVVGSIIGRGGSIINNLMAQSGARIQMQQKDELSPSATQRGITLSGSVSQVAEAERLILQIVAQNLLPSGSSGGGGSGGGGGGYGYDSGASSSTSQTITVPISSIGSIIGRGGSVIRGLIEQSGANIKIQQKEDMRPGAVEREISLMGSPSNIETARRLIMDIVADTQQGGASGPSVGGQTKKTIYVRDSDVGSLIGRGGSVIKSLIADSGCHIQIAQKDNRYGGGGSGSGDREVVLSGTPDQIDKATRLINETCANIGGPPPPRGGHGYGMPPPPGAPYYPPPPPGAYPPYSPYGAPPGPPPPGPPPPGAPPAPYNPYGMPPQSPAPSQQQQQQYGGYGQQQDAYGSQGADSSHGYSAAPPTQSYGEYPPAPDSAPAASADYSSTSSAQYHNTSSASYQNTPDAQYPNAAPSQYSSAPPSQYSYPPYPPSTGEYNPYGQ